MGSGGGAISQGLFSAPGLWKEAQKHPLSNWFMPTPDAVLSRQAGKAESTILAFKKHLMQTER